MESPTGAVLPHSYHLSNAVGVSQDVFLCLIPSACEKTSQQRHRAPPPTAINKPQMRPTQEEEPQTQGYICPRRSHSQSSGGVGETSESREASPQCHHDVTCRDGGGGAGSEKATMLLLLYRSVSHGRAQTREKALCHRVLVAVCQFLVTWLCMKQTLWPGFWEESSISCTKMMVIA